MKCDMNCLLLARADHEVLICLPCNFVNRHVQSICNCVKLRASVVVNIMEFTARPHAKFCLARTGNRKSIWSGLIFSCFQLHSSCTTDACESPPTLAPRLVKHTHIQVEMPYQLCKCSSKCRHASFNKAALDVESICLQV